MKTGIEEIYSGQIQPRTRLQLPHLQTRWHSDDKALLSKNLQSGGGPVPDSTSSCSLHCPCSPAVTQAYGDSTLKAGEIPSG